MRWRIFFRQSDSAETDVEESNRKYNHQNKLIKSQILYAKTNKLKVLAKKSLAVILINTPSPDNTYQNKLHKY